VRYKEVVVRPVETVTLSSDRQRVLAGVRLVRSAASIAVDDSYFWVVRPRIGIAGVTGLGTLISAPTSAPTRARRTSPRPLHRPGDAAAGAARRAGPRSSTCARATSARWTWARPSTTAARGSARRGLQARPSGRRADRADLHRVAQRAAGDEQSRFWNASGLDLELTASGLSLNAQTLTSW
jgi:paraquat-inducible protein B